MELYKASHQWATRPADERFWTVQDLHAACQGFREEAGLARVPYTALAAVALGDGDQQEVALVGPQGKPATLTNWSFGQLAARAEAPASYLRTLPATLAASCINTGLQRREDDEQASLLFHRNGGLRCHCMVTDRYSRIWNADITKRLCVLGELGWRTPPARPVPGWTGPTRPAVESDLIHGGNNGLSINLGDLVAPAGLYASDHDLFAFLIREDRVIDGGNGEFLNRGFFAWNSEVGAASFGIMTFLYDNVCGNHIVWGAKGVKELRVRHIGDANDRAFNQLEGELIRYADESVSDLEAQIASAKRHVLGANKDLVLDTIFGLRIPALSRRRAADAYDIAELTEQYHGAPNTAWGFASGITRLSQTVPYADERVALDRAAGKVLEIAF